MRINIEDGSIVTFYGITWNNGWDFDAPSIITSPGLFYSDNYEGLDGLIEELCIDLSVDFYIDSEEELIEDEWRGWNVSQFDKFIKDKFENKQTPTLDYFKKFKKEIENVLIVRETIKFTWNSVEEYYNTDTLEYEEKWVNL